MMQGDSYNMSIELLKKDGTAITSSEVQDVEITIGYLSKRWSDGEVTYGSGLWGFPISQAESFKFPASHVKAQARVKWKDGTVEGFSLGRVCVDESTSKEVL